MHWGEIAIKPEDGRETAGRKHNKKKDKKKANVRFILAMVVVSFTLSVVFSYASDVALLNVNNLSAFAILLLFVCVGTLFDIVGMAVASADEKPFHSMAARKVHGAKESIWLVKNAERVSSFCNDVIGDICGIMSGSVSAVITVQLVTNYNWNDIVVSLLLSGIVASLTIGTKAMGKTVAVNSSEKVVFTAGKLIHLFTQIPKGKR